MANTIHSIISNLYSKVTKSGESVTACFSSIEKDFENFVSECEKSLDKKTYKSFFSACNRVTNAGDDSAIFLSGLEKFTEQIENMFAGGNMVEGDRERVTCLGTEDDDDSKLISNMYELIQIESKMAKSGSVGLKNWLYFTSLMCKKSMRGSFASMTVPENPVFSMHSAFEFFSKNFGLYLKAKTPEGASGALRGAVMRLGSADQKSAEQIGLAAEKLISYMKDAAKKLSKFADTGEEAVELSPNEKKNVLLILNGFAAHCNVLGKKLSVYESNKSFSKLIKNLEKTRSYVATAAKNIKNLK